MNILLQWLSILTSRIECVFTAYSRSMANFQFVCNKFSYYLHSTELYFNHGKSKMGSICCRCTQNVSDCEFDNAYGSYFDHLSDNYFEYNKKKKENLGEPAISVPIRVRALCTHEGNGSDSLKFSKGDIILVDEYTCDNYIYGTHAVTKQSGYVHKNMICFDDGTPRSLEAWFPIDRLDAELRLLLPGQVNGTYIVRKRSGDNQKFALSVLNYDGKTNQKIVRHYIIHQDKSGYYLIETDVFETMGELIAFYSCKKGPLHCTLTKPCPKTKTPEVPFRELELERSGVTFGNFLGKGEFGEVFEGRLNNSLPIAIKRLLNPEKRQEFINEATSLHRLRHPRILQILGVCTQPPEEPILIITEFMSRGSLREVLKDHVLSPWDMSFTVLLMCQITDGMRYLESKSCVHSDLRAANILVHQDYSIKVADFGLVQFLNGHTPTKTEAKFPIRWTAPEAAIKSLYSSKSDVWSFGIVMYEILTYGKTPYEDIESKDVVARVNQGYRLPNPLKEDEVNGEMFYKIMLSCWEAEPNDRPSFKDLHKQFAKWETAQLKLPLMGCVR